MRAICLCLLLSGCALPLGLHTRLELRPEGAVRHRAGAARPAWSLGLRLFLSRRP